MLFGGPNVNVYVYKNIAVSEVAQWTNSDRN